MVLKESTPLNLRSDALTTHELCEFYNISIKIVFSNATGFISNATGFKSRPRCQKIPGYVQTILILNVRKIRFQIDRNKGMRGINHISGFRI